MANWNWPYINVINGLETQYFAEVTAPVFPVPTGGRGEATVQGTGMPVWNLQLGSWPAGQPWTRNLTSLGLSFLL